MYRITVKNLKTGVILWEYGFSKTMIKKIYRIFNSYSAVGNYKKYKIIEVTKLKFSLLNFKKCLTNHSEVI